MRPPLFIGQLALIRWAELINAIGKYANESRLTGFPSPSLSPNWILSSSFSPLPRGSLRCTDVFEKCGFTAFSSKRKYSVNYYISPFYYSVICCWFFNLTFSCRPSIRFLINVQQLSGCTPVNEFVLPWCHARYSWVPLAFDSKKTLCRLYNWTCTLHPFLWFSLSLFFPFLYSTNSDSDTHSHSIQGHSHTVANSLSFILFCLIFLL